MFFRNLQIYRLTGFSTNAAHLSDLLAEQAFVPCTSMDMTSAGWVAPRNGGMLVHAPMGAPAQLLIELATETKILPAGVVNQVAEARAAELEEQQGFRPGRRQMKELKERVADELLPRAFSKVARTRAWIDTAGGWLIVDAASPGKADEIVKRLLKAIPRFPVENLRVQISPITAMTHWLNADEAPQGFTVDQDTILRATGESKATVRYQRVAIEPDDMRRHIDGGKQVAQLALTWADRISFTLTESLTIKGVKPLDVLTESDNASIKDADERFDSDFVLMAGELSRLLGDLVAVLGGEAQERAAA